MYRALPVTFFHRIVAYNAFLAIQFFPVTMEKLGAAQQQQLKKMSNDRLRIKLMAQGYDEDIVIGMEREELIATYAELLASGKLKVSPGAVGGVA